MTKTEKLLAVLDLPNKPQDEMAEMYNWTPVDVWICQNILTGGDETIAYQKGYLSRADLAFRLRDEIVKADLANETDCWCEASYEVFLYVIGEENEKDEVGLDTWFSMYAKPIHWIIAALIAKQKEKP